jgi:hypothetical protein
MPPEDRRASPRFALKIPVRFYCSDVARGEEIAAHAVNISRTGLYLSSPKRLAVGSALALRLQVPIEISGSAFRELRCTGRVVYEHESSGGLGYGVQIEQAPFGFRSFSQVKTDSTALA